MWANFHVLSDGVFHLHAAAAIEDCHAPVVGKVEAKGGAREEDLEELEISILNNVVHAGETVGVRDVGVRAQLQKQMCIFRILLQNSQHERGVFHGVSAGINEAPALHQHLHHLRAFVVGGMVQQSPPVHELVLVQIQIFLLQQLA